MDLPYLFNENVNFRNQGLYGIVALLSALVFITALGPGFMGLGGSWQYDAFHMLCHQMPDRSFTYNEYQMAVCSRCFGIYSFFLIFWLIMPAFALFNKKKKQWYVRILITTILINVLDVVGNYFHIWTNTLTSRFILGALIGIAIILLLRPEFFKLTTERDHGKYRNE